MNHFYYQLKNKFLVSLFATFILITIGISGCSYYNPPPQDLDASRILIIGDSYLAMHRGLYRAMAERGLIVNDHSMEGAQLSGNNFLFAPDISDQFRNSDISNINIVIMNGGGNDLAFQCSESIIDQDQWKPIVQKAMDNLVHIWGGIDRKKIRHVFYIGYPYPPYLSEKQKIVFKYYNDQVKYNLCPSNKIVFIDLRDTISPLQAEYFMEDRIHPSDLTYKLMAKLIKEQFEKYRIF